MPIIRKVEVLENIGLEIGKNISNTDKNKFTTLFIDGNHLMTSFFSMFIFITIFNAFNARTERLNIFANLKENIHLEKFL